MNNDSNKDNVNRDIACRSHSARTDRELYRICPSKLSKRELEDLYFALLENNLELKRTINAQKDRIKVLSTKVQRMSAIQKSKIEREQGCCPITKAVANDQRESIADLKKANERMSERIRLLNMRLCSAKQFLKSPMQTMNRFKGCPNANSTIKNSSMSALTSKRSDNNLKTNVPSSQYLDKEVDTIVENEPIEIEKESKAPGVSSGCQTSQDEHEKCCESKCKTIVEELKQKIVNLQEELSESKEALSVRAARLEGEVALHRQHIRERDARLDELANQLRTANDNFEDLSVQLSVERRKVAELETRIKAQDLSHKVARTIEQHLSNINESLKPQQEKPAKLLDRLSVPNCVPFYPADHSSPRSEEPSASSKLIKNVPESSPDTKMSKYSDDSGYLEGRNQESDDKDINHVNLELMKRIYYLQAQLDALKASATRDSLNEAQIHSSVYETDQHEPQRVVSLKSEEPKKDVVFQTRDCPNETQTSKKDDEIGLKRNPSDEAILTKDLKRLSVSLKTEGHIDDKKFGVREDKQILSTSTTWPTRWEHTTPSASKGTYSLSGLNSREQTPSLPLNASVSSELVVRDCNVTKSDNHNKYQIPGPIPSKHTSKAAVKKRIKEMLKHMQRSDNPTGVSDDVNNFLSEKTLNSMMTDNSFVDDRCKLSDSGVSKHDDIEDTKVPKIAEAGKLEAKSIVTERIDHQTPTVTLAVPDKQPDVTDVKKTKTLKIDDEEEQPEGIVKTKDSIDLTHRQLANAKRDSKDKGDTSKGARVADPKIHSIPVDKLVEETDADLQSHLKDVPVNEGIKEVAKQTDAQPRTLDASTITELIDCKVEEIDVCSGQSRVCRCSGVRRSLSVFRSCSGTLRFRTVAAPAGPKFRQCACATHCGTSEPQPGFEPKSCSSPLAQNTYTVPPGDVLKCSRPTSPDNTEHEISSLTDLPSEREGKSPRVLSLGEDKGTTTYSESRTPSPDNATLSLGEMPAWGRKQYNNTPSVGEEAASTSRNMEAALQAITEELARCKHLLTQHSQSQAAHPPVAEAGTSPTALIAPRPQAARLPVAEAGTSPTAISAPRPQAARPPVAEAGTSPTALSAPRPQAARPPVAEAGTSPTALSAPRPQAARPPVAEAGTSPTALSAPRPQAARPPVAEAGTSPACNHFALHRAPARPSLGDVSAPTCVFTLHIGTLVLSDEAVLNSRNMSLVLTWKFYNQNVSMTRMKAGRVVLFDFSTEYDVGVTNDFLRYLKYEEMPINICEVDNIDEPFASCSLPLRDALLHTNKRSDMSLALIAGPRIKHAHASDALDSGDEMGVLDLWCMLRADAKLMPTINHTMPKHAAPTSTGVHKRSRMRQPEIDDEPSNDRISTDLDLHQRSINAPMSLNNQPINKVRSASATQKTTIDNLYLDPTPQKSSVEIQSEQWKGSDQLASRILLNEVPVNIKSTEEMKQALERNVQDSCLKVHPVSRLPKVDDDVSQVTSIGSMMKMAFAKKQMHKTKWTPHNSFSGEGGIPRCISLSKDAPGRPYSEEDEELNVVNSRKGLKESKKSVTILPCDNQRDENQQETSEAEDAGDSVSITILWLALNEECEAMVNPRVQRLYVAYSFLGRSGAELETPVSLPKPRHYIEKCYFNFKKTFRLHDSDLPLLGHMARCRSGSREYSSIHDSVIFTVISEPPEDPLGLESCEDIGSAQLFLGDVVAFSGDSSEYTEVVPVRAASGAVVGVLAVRLAGLALVRRCLALAHSHHTLRRWYPRAFAPYLPHYLFIIHHFMTHN